MYRLFFKGLVSFYRLGGGVKDFWRTHGSRGDTGGRGGGRISCRLKEYKQGL